MKSYKEYRMVLLNFVLLIFLSLSYQNCAKNPADFSRRPNESPLFQEEFSDSPNQPSINTTLRAENSSRLAINNQWNYDIFVNPTPSSFFAAHDAYAPHNAQIDFEGSYSFAGQSYVIAFHAEINSTPSALSNWIISNISYSKNGVISDIRKSGVSITSDSINDGFGGLPTRYLFISSTKRFLINWKASMTPSSKYGLNMGPVLLPRYGAKPWRGNKKWLFLEVKQDETPLFQIINNERVFTDSAYEAKELDIIKSTMVKAFFKMSSSQLNLNFEEKEVVASQTAINLAKICFDDLDGEQNFYADILKSVYPRVINSSRGGFDLFNITLSTQFSSLCPSQLQNGHGGAIAPSPQFPWMRPGAIIKSYNGNSVLKAWGSPYVFAHEFGHALGIQERYFNPIYNCSNFNVNRISPDQIFYPYEFYENNEGRCMLSYNAAVEDAMFGGATSYSVRDRAMLGWLSGDAVNRVFQENSLGFDSIHFV